MADDDITAGWYTDSEGAIRWWDGAEWTEQVRDAGDVQATAVMAADRTASTATARRVETDDDEPDHRRRTWLVATFVGLLAFFLGMAIGGNGSSPDPAVVDEATASSGATTEDLDQREEDLKSREQELASKQEDLDQREQDLDARESASPSVPSGDGTIGNGVFEVGTDVQAGQYTTPGAEEPDLDCRYKVSSDEAGDQIITSRITQGTGTVSLEEGQFFTSEYCQPWTSESPLP